MTDRQIMTGDEIRRAIIRISHEIVEKQAGTDGLALVGIQRRGVPLARRIADAIEEHENQDAQQCVRQARPEFVGPTPRHAQPDHAARVTRLGVGRKLARSRYTADRIARELTALLGDPRPAQRAADIGARIRAERGVETACDALERALR